MVHINAVVAIAKCLKNEKRHLLKESRNRNAVHENSSSDSLVVDKFGYTCEADNCFSHTGEESVIHKNPRQTVPISILDESIFHELDELEEGEENDEESVGEQQQNLQEFTSNE